MNVSNLSLESWFCGVIYQTEIEEAIQKNLGLHDADRLTAITATFNEIITKRKCLTRDWFADTTKKSGNKKCL